MARKHYLTDAFVTDLLGLYALLLSAIRSAVEKHGGSLEKDPVTGEICVVYPEWAEKACLMELDSFLGDGQALQDALSVLGGVAHLENERNTGIINAQS